MQSPLRALVTLFFTVASLFLPSPLSGQSANIIFSGRLSDIPDTNNPPFSFPAVPDSDIFVGMGDNLNPYTIRANTSQAAVDYLAVGLHSNAGISVFGLICCTQIPEFEVIDVL